MSRSNTRQAGFTIIELLIATTVFSVILLLLTQAIIQIGRIYYKGVISSQTQEVARSIMTTISQSVQFSGGDVNVGPIDNTFNSTSKAFCVGNTYYTYRNNLQLTDETTVQAGQTKHAFMVSEGAANCKNVPDLSTDPVAGRELLSPKMRVYVKEGTPIIQAIGSNANLYKIHLLVIYGDNDVINLDGMGNPVSCKSYTAGGSFCAFSELETIVQKRI